MGGGGRWNSCQSACLTLPARVEGKLESEMALLRLGRATQAVWGGLGPSSGMSQVSGSQTCLCLWTLWGSFLNPGQQPPSPQPDWPLSCDGWGHKDLLSCRENLPSPTWLHLTILSLWNHFCIWKRFLQCCSFKSIWRQKLIHLLYETMTLISLPQSSFSQNSYFLSRDSVRLKPSFLFSFPFPLHSFSCHVQARQCFSHLSPFLSHSQPSW